jgi:hypothetical protein
MITSIAMAPGGIVASPGGSQVSSRSWPDQRSNWIRAGRGHTTRCTTASSFRNCRNGVVTEIADPKDESEGCPR